MYDSNKTFKTAFIVSLFLHGIVMFIINGNLNSSLIETVPSMPDLSISLTQSFSEVLPEISEVPEVLHKAEPLKDVREEETPADPVLTELPVEEVVSSEDPLLLAKEIPEEIPENSISSLASSAKSLETAEPFPETGVYSGQKLEDLDFSGAVRMPAPVYPSRARKMEWEGDVTVSFVINKKGKIESIIIEESTGYELLDKTVFNTVKKGWRFPRRDDPVRVWKTFSFRLI